MPKQRERKSHIWKKHNDNWYVEPAWCADVLFRDVTFTGTVHDPCCGMGTIPDAAVMTGDLVVTMSDIKDRGAHPWWGPDFSITRYQDDERMHDNIVTNPPFDDINKSPWPFIEWALAHARYKVALLVPFKWLAGDRRTRYLETKPLSQIFLMTPRPSMPPGDALMAMRARGEKPEGGKEDFAWVIFDNQMPAYSYVTMGWMHRDKDEG